MESSITIGMDLGDTSHLIVVFDADGTEIQVAKVNNSKRCVEQFFQSYKAATVALEAGTHSPWISRLLEKLGCKVLVGNPRKLRLIWDSHDKSDERDARILGMICRVEPRLLWPLRHRGVQAQADLAIIKSRAMLVKTRTGLISHVRGMVKAMGYRLPACSAASFAARTVGNIPDELIPAVNSVIEMIDQLSAKIKGLDNMINQLCEKRYAESKLLQQVAGVGPITAMAYVLTIEDPARFKNSRQVGAFLGLTPKQDQSGQTDKQLRISKAGNKYLRQLLVSCAQYTLGPFGPESNLRRYGMAIAARGGRNAKKRAVVAVARKLSVLLHRLWCSGETYQPFYGRVNLKAA
jgi:transposase